MNYYLNNNSNVYSIMLKLSEVKTCLGVMAQDLGGLKEIGLAEGLGLDVSAGDGLTIHGNGKA